MIKLLSLFFVMTVVNSQTTDPSSQGTLGPPPLLQGQNPPIVPDGPLLTPADSKEPLTPPPDPKIPLVPPTPDTNGKLTPPPGPDGQRSSSGDTSRRAHRVPKCKKSKSKRYLYNERNFKQKRALRNSNREETVDVTGIFKENDFDYFYFYPDGRYQKVDSVADPPLAKSNPQRSAQSTDTDFIVSKYYEDPPIQDSPANDPAPKAKSAKAASKKKKGKNNNQGGIADGDWCPGDGRSRSPTPAPTLSNAPTISPKPSINVKVCTALENNETPEKTAVAVEVIFRYNMIRKNTVAANDAIKTISNFIQKGLAGALLGCPSSMVFTQGNVRTLIERETYILAIRPGRVDADMNVNRRSLQVASLEQKGSGSVNPNVPCSDKIEGPRTSATSCDAVDDSVTVYLVPNSPKSSAQSATDDTLTALRTLMNTQASAVMASNNGIQGLLFIGVPGSSNNSFNPPPRIEGNSNLIASSGLSGAGKGLIVGSCILILILAIVAIRRRRVTQYRTKTAYEDDNLFLFSKTMDMYSKTPRGDTDTVSTTSSNWRRARGAHVMGEGDSVSPPDTGSILDDIREAESRSLYGSSPLSGDFEDDLLSRDSHDVHRCQSATCDVCAQRRSLVFVPTNSPQSYLSIRSPSSRPYQPSDTVHL